MQKLRSKILCFADGKLSTERAKLVTESYKKTEGEKPAIRKSKAFHHVMSNISIEFLEDELIIGNPNSGFGKVEVDPEYMSDWLNEKIDLNGKQISELRSLNTREHNKLDADDEVWSGATINTWGAVVYDDTLSSDDLICYFDFAAQKSVSTGSLTLQWSTNGLMTIAESE